MAVQRLALSDYIEEIRRAIGEETAALSEIDDADLARVINGYIQNLPMRCAEVATQAGVRIGSGTIRFDFWKTAVNSTTTAGAGNFVVAAGSSDMDLPNDYDHWISWYDRTNNRPFHVIRETSRWHRDIKERIGVPRYVEIRDLYAGGSSTWRRRATLYPAVVSGITPDIELTYWRLPASMPNTTAASEYPDIDIKFQWLPVWGVVVELMRPGDPAYERYAAQERNMILAMLQSARAA